MAKGRLKVSRTNKGKIFVEIDKLNNKPPMPISYVVFPNTDLNGKDCQYEIDSKGILTVIRVDGVEVWSRQVVQAAAAQIANIGAAKFVDSFKLQDTFLPKDVQGLNFLDIDNFALKLQKAARYETTLNKDKYKFAFFKNDPRERIYFEIKANYGHLKDNFEVLCKRQAQQVEGLFPNKSRRIELHPQWRFVLGLGGESVYETNMTLHHVYGIPFLPSSSIKGVLRSWVIAQIFAYSDNVPSTEVNYPLINAEYRAITSSKLFCTIFGCPKSINNVLFNKLGEPMLKSLEQEEKIDNDKNTDVRILNVRKTKYVYEQKQKNNALNSDSAYQGEVVFFDGIPSVAPIIKTDVMNVHYKDWYKEIGYSAPTDTQKTNPIHFLTVSNENNLLFQTYIACQNNRKLSEVSEDYGIFIQNTTLTADSTVLDLVKHWLTNALLHHGIGAKTAVGYGYMK